MADHLGIAVKPGDPIKADDFMKLVATVNALLSPRGGDGIDVQQVGGHIHASAIPPVNAYLAVATSNFAARSGTTPGTGTVDLYWFDGTNLAATGDSLADVVNVSTTTMTSGNSIDSGMYCWVYKDAFSTWYVAPLECS
jgi:hypothetical protein